MPKRCTRCGEDKQLSEFQTEKRSSDGVTSRCKQCLSAYQKSWYQEKGGMYHRVSRYGITPDEYHEMLEEQLSCCGCCGSPDPRRKAGFVIDHDHNTGKIRGLLCHNCNIGIGQLGDSLDGLNKAVAYLRRHYDIT
jgi:hypothetical protein